MISGWYDPDYSHINNLESCKCVCHGKSRPWTHECCGKWTNTEGPTTWYSQPIYIPKDVR